LYGDVDERKSRATIEPGVVMVKIPKREQKEWPQLKAAGSAADIKARRDAALEVKRARDEQAISDVKEKKRQDDDYVFHKQWDLEKDEKRTIERLAELHKREAEQSLYQWSDAAEGRADAVAPGAAALETEEVQTYFDKQLVEGELDPFEAKEGVVPLPGTYHKKTARSVATEKALRAEPDRDFDIRAKDGEGGNSDAALTKEKEKEMEMARKVRKEAAEQERLAELKRAEDHKREEQERIMPLPLRESAARKDEGAEGAGNGGGEEQGTQMAVWKEGESGSEDEDGVEGTEEGGTGQGKVGRGEENGDQEEAADSNKVDLVRDEEQLLGRKRGASLNRWEAEKIAEQHRQVAEAYFKVGLVSEAKLHEMRARDAAPWLDEARRNYDTPQEAEARRKREEEEEAARPKPREDLPAPRAGGSVQVTHTMHR
jgi:hypothetical protein